MSKDYYRLLSVGRNASDADIKKSYRKLAMKYHPDRNPGDSKSAAQFKEINEAYTVLGDAKKRAMYDRYGPEMAQAQGRQGGQGGQGFEGFGGDFSNLNEMFGDVFENFFGDRSSRSSRNEGMAGESLKLALDIEFSESILGCKKEVSYSLYDSCDRCGGNGSAKGSSPQQCGACQGAGKVRSQQGVFIYEQTCVQCRGQGMVISDPCPSCNAEGRVAKKKSLPFDIPAGISDGDSIKNIGAG